MLPQKWADPVEIKIRQNLQSASSCLSSEVCLSSLASTGRVIQPGMKTHRLISFQEMAEKLKALEIGKCLQNKYRTVQELRSTFSHTKSINSDFSLV